MASSGADELEAADFRRALDADRQAHKSHAAVHVQIVVAFPVQAAQFKDRG